MQGGFSQRSGKGPGPASISIGPVSALGIAGASSSPQPTRTNAPTTARKQANFFMCIGFSSCQQPGGWYHAPAGNDKPGERNTLATSLQPDGRLGGAHVSLRIRGADG